MERQEIHIAIEEDAAVKIQRVRFLYIARKSIIDKMIKENLQVDQGLLDYYQKRYEESYIDYQEMLEAVRLNYLSGIKEGTVIKWGIDLSTSEIIATVCTRKAGKEGRDADDKTA